MLAGLLLLAATVAAHPFGPLTHKQHQRQTLIPGDDSQLSFIQTHITPSTNSGQPVRVTGATVLGVETFLGIPFGEAPIGELRFEHPRPKVYDRPVIALWPPPACIQRGSALTGAFGTSEDCLQLNILAPEGTVGQGRSLPVMVWIFGGAFVAGAGNTYLSPNLVNHGVEIGRPFVLVTINYRVDIWGWGYGREMADALAANNGLRDQILALQWVRENIAAFGGDPTRVTVFGQSAGAISIASLLLNETQDLFRGAIMMSGAASTSPIGATNSTWQSAFDLVAQHAGCGAETDKLNCLKTVSAEELVAASREMSRTYPMAFPLAPSIDGDLIPYSPYQMLKDGKFARIPFIIGATRDEGTVFVPANISAMGLSVEDLFNSLYPAPVDPGLKARIIERYPEVAALGAPFNTGDEVWNTSALFKQAAAIITDAAFQSRRRWFLRQANAHGFISTWSYEFEGETPFLSAHLGIAHGTDVPFAFGIASRLLGYTEENVEIGRAMMGYFINFAYFLNPNGGPTTDPATNSTPLSTTRWRNHIYPYNQNTLHMAPGAFGVIQDDFREERMNVFNEPEVAAGLWMRRGV